MIAIYIYLFMDLIFISFDNKKNEVPYLPTPKSQVINFIGKYLNQKRDFPMRNNEVTNDDKGAVFTSKISYYTLG